MKPKYLRDKDPWMLAEDIPDCDLFFSQIWLNCFVQTFHRQTGRAYKKVLAVYRGYHLLFYYGEQDSKKVGDVIARKFLQFPRFTEKVNRECIRWAQEMTAFARSIPIKRLEKFSDQKLLELYERHFQIHQGRYEWGWIPVAVDMFHNNLTNRLKYYLLEKGVGEENLNPSLVLLTQPLRKSPVQIEQESLLKIASKLKRFKKKLPSAVRKALTAHFKKYFFTKYNFIGSQGVYDFDYYLAELKRVLSEGRPLKMLRDIAAKAREDQAKRQKLLKALKIEEPWKTILDNWGEFMVTKVQRRYGQIYLLYRMEFVLREIARRFGLSLMQVRFMLPREVKALFRTGEVPEDLHKRTQFCVHYAERDFEQVYTGKFAEKLAKQTERSISGSITQLTGQTGCPGYGKGRVKVIIRAEDMKKFEKGDILVSIATDPDIVPAMKKAAAIVTEQGGITSHAAIVSRELGIPCVIGTKIATKVFKDGDLVEVDANKGVVRRLKDK